MTLRHRLAAIVRLLLGRDRAEHDLDRELRAFVDMAAADKARDGIPAAEARRQALIELGGLEQTKERVRVSRHGARLDELGRDAHYAWRMFTKHRGFTAVVVLTLMLGIGANTAIFGLIDALMLRALPVHKPHELVLVTFRSPAEREVSQSFSYAMARALSDQRDIFAGAAGFSGSTFDVGGPGGISRVRGALVTGDYYGTLGLQPAAGRLLTRADDEGGTPLVAVISDGYWERQFARRRDAVGDTLLINALRVTIVGVSPPGFNGANVGAPADITLPVSALPWVEPQAAPLLEPGNFWLRVLARPAAGLRAREAEARIALRWRELAEAAVSPAWPASRREDIIKASVQLSPGGTGWTSLREIYVQPLLILMAVVGIVLLIACANVASLLLARAASRQREIAVRLALGAGRARIVRQLLLESLLLASVGAALGIGLAWISGTAILDVMSIGRRSLTLDLTPNLRILGFTTAVAAFTAILFGVIPALHATGRTAPDALRNDTRVGSARSRLLPVLVCAQVALSLVLLVGAALFVRTLHNLENFDPGFKASGLLIVELAERRSVFADDLADEVRRIPGVVSASFSTHTPLSGSLWSEPAVPAGQSIPERDTAVFVGAGPQFFETMQIPLVAGRGFSNLDSSYSAPVAVVNERFAQRYFDGANPVGQRLSAIVRGKRTELDIIGVVRSAYATGLRTAPPSTVYVAYAQLTGGVPTSLEVRAAGHLGDVSANLKQFLQTRFPDAPIEVRPLSAQVDATLVQERMLAMLAGAFGLVALVLASVGLYGLLSYRVAQRTKEIGIRLAVGAQRRQVVALVAAGAARLIVLGVVIAIPVIWAVRRWIDSMLFGLEATDAGAMLTAIGVLLVVAQLAIGLPAWRAARVDPLPALRHE